MYTWIIYIDLGLLVRGQTYKVYPAAARTLSLQQCSQLCSWSCCCGPATTGWRVAASKSGPMSRSEYVNTSMSSWGFGLFTITQLKCYVKLPWRIIPQSLRAAGIRRNKAKHGNTGFSLSCCWNHLHLKTQHNSK